MKKILIITLEFPPTIGGIATYVHDLAASLQNNQVVVLAPEAKDAKDWDALQRYKIIRKKMLFSPFIWPRWIKLYFLVKNIVKTEKIDILMIHHALPVGYVGIILRKRLPFLLFSHGTDIVAGSRTKWKKLMMAKVVESAEQIIFNSVSLRTRFLNMFPGYEEKSLTLYPCPEHIFFTPPDASAVESLRDKYALRGKQVLLTISRITAGKGFMHLVRMMPEILQKNPNLVWLIVGDGNQRTEMMKEIQQLYLQNIVRYVGQVPHADLPAFYAVADLFVLLTHPEGGTEEGLGLVFLEAGAAGLPIVAGKSGGVDEGVHHGETGYVFDVLTEQLEIMQAILALLADAKKRLDMGVKGKEFVRGKFDWKEELKKLDQWLK